MGLTDRLFNVTRAWINSQKDKVTDKEPYSYKKDDFDFSEFKRQRYSEKSAGNSRKKSGKPYFFDQKHDLYEDLNVFNLPENATFNEVKKAYKSECKKYHSDFFWHDKEKKEAANSIMVIFNSAYDRLQKYFKKK